MHSDSVQGTRLSINEESDEASTVGMGVKQRNRMGYFSSSTQGSQGSQMKIESQ